MKALINQIKLQKDICIFGVACMGVLYLFATILFEVMMAVDGDVDEVICIGSMMAMMGIVAALLFGVMSHMVNVFNYAVSLGRTRKSFFPAYAMAVFVSAVVLEAFFVLLHAIERARVGFMYPQARIEDPAAFMLNWGALAAMALFGTAFGVFFASLVIRFGKLALWGLCVLWVAVCIGSPRFLELMFEYPESPVSRAALRVADWFFGLGGLGLPVFAACIAAVMLVAGYLLVRRQQVNL